MLLAYIPEVYAAGGDFTQPNYRVIIDGELTDMTVNLNQDVVYVPVRDMAERLGAQVYWNQLSGVILYYNETTYWPEHYLYESKAMVPVDYLTRILGCEVEFYEGFNVLSVMKEASGVDESGLYHLLPSYDGYTSEDLEWMAKIIHAEAKGEPYEAKIAVGSVILNRKYSGIYPDTVKGVIFDNKNGVQFTPTVNGSIYNTPSRDSWLAALEVLEGKRNAENALFFINPAYAKSSWVSRNREYAFTLMNHDFYY